MPYFSKTVRATTASIRDYEGSHGHIYVHRIEFTDGEQCNWHSIESDPSIKFPLNQSVTYEYTGEEKDTTRKIKPQKPNPNTQVAQTNSSVPSQQNNQNQGKSSGKKSSGRYSGPSGLATSYAKDIIIGSWKGGAFPGLSLEDKKSKTTKKATTSGGISHDRCIEIAEKIHTWMTSKGDEDFASFSISYAKDLIIASWNGDCLNMPGQPLYFEQIFSIARDMYNFMEKKGR